jgi:hypothetical protein
MACVLAAMIAIVFFHAAYRSHCCSAWQYSPFNRSLLTLACFQ